MNDGELLRSYREAGDEKAFRELIERHADMIYSTAFRRIGDAHAAEDVTQAVFCLLLRKAGRLYDVPDLAAWLHRATCWKASEQLRAERRRQFHEHAAARMNESPNPADDRWSEIAPHLDENLNRLNAPDRRLILLRYYRRLSLREVGAAFGVSEDAVRMRIGRALERLRRRLSGSVPAVIASAALDELLMAHAAEPAPALAGRANRRRRPNARRPDCGGRESADALDRPYFHNQSGAGRGRVALCGEPRAVVLPGSQ